MPTGTATTGRPMNEMGCVIRPMLGRDIISTPLMVIMSWPIFVAVRGVAGARITSTSLKSFITSV